MRLGNREETPKQKPYRAWRKSRPSKFYRENVMSTNLAEIESRLWSAEERIAENVVKILEDKV